MTTPERVRVALLHSPFLSEPLNRFAITSLFCSSFPSVIQNAELILQTFPNLEVLKVIDSNTICSEYEFNLNMFSRSKELFIKCFTLPRFSFLPPSDNSETPKLLHLESLSLEDSGFPPPMDSIMSLLGPVTGGQLRSLSTSLKITDFQIFPKLESLFVVIHDFENIEDFRKFSSQKLTSLTMTLAEPSMASHVEFNRFPKLESLHVASVEILDQIPPNNVVGITSLRSLILDGGVAVSIDSFADSTNLTKLALRLPSQLTECGFISAVGRLKQLSHLDLECCFLIDNGGLALLRVLSELSALTYLRLFSWKTSDQIEPTIFLPYIPITVQELHLEKFHFENHDMELLHRLERLEVLALAFHEATFISDGFLEPLKSMKTLKSLSMVHTYPLSHNHIISSEFLSGLCASLPNLEVLKSEGMTLKSDQRELLATYPHIDYIRVKNLKNYEYSPKVIII